MTITEFLLDRIAEDETTSVHEIDCGYAMAEYGKPCSCGWEKRMDRACEAKRRIVEHCEPDPITLSPGDDYVLRSLASEYADHPDYREEWRP